jgi:hypothetical protein
VTRLLRYWRTGAPWTAAWDGMAAPDDDDNGSGCADWAREPARSPVSCCCCSLRRGVPVALAGAGDCAGVDSEAGGGCACCWEEGAACGWGVLDVAVGSEVVWGSFYKVIS